MAKSEYEFSRWVPQSTNTWAYTVFRKYDLELTRINAAYYTSRKYIYRGLKNAGATWDATLRSEFGFLDDEVGRYRDIYEWSKLYNEFDNWTNLNSLLTLAANLETYLAATVKLAIKSNPGVLLGVSQLIDGAKLLKDGIKGPTAARDIVEACTRGDWSSRINAFSQTFGHLPAMTAAHSDLEYVRKVRNDVGHAFGRDIELAQEHGSLNKAPIANLKHDRFRKLQMTMRRLVREIDAHLLQGHIGEFEFIDFYSKQPAEHRALEMHQRVWHLKKAIGRYGSVPKGKLYCSGLLSYWDEL